MKSREREVSKIYHSSWILPILDFAIDAKLNYDATKVWKRVWILEARSENGCGKRNIGLKLGQDLGNRAAHPYQEFRRVPPPPPGGKCHWQPLSVWSHPPIQPTHECERRMKSEIEMDHYIPYSLRTECGFFDVPQSLNSNQSCPQSSRSFPLLTNR